MNNYAMISDYVVSGNEKTALSMKLTPLYLAMQHLLKLSMMVC